MARRLHYGTRLPSGKPRAGTCISYNVNDPKREIKPFTPKPKDADFTVEYDETTGEYYTKDSRLR